MDYLPFVLWMILYPLSYYLQSFLATKERILLKRESYKDSVKVASQFINFMIWIVIGITLFQAVS